MTRPSWWVRLLARLRPARPLSTRRLRPRAALALEPLPPRDSPSSLDPGGFAPFATPPPVESVVTSAPRHEPTPPPAGVPTAAPVVLNIVKIIKIAADAPGLNPAETHGESSFSTLSNRPPRPDPPAGQPRQPDHRPEGNHAPPDAPAVASTPRPASAVSVRAVSVARVAATSFDGWRVVARVVRPEAPPAADAPPAVAAPAANPTAAAVPPTPTPLTVVPVVSSVALPLAADAPLFRVVGTTPATVSYTLAAHSAAGTTAAGGTVAVSGGGAVATLTPPPALVGLSPDVLTVLIVTRPASVSATLFVVPPQRVSDPALIAAHRGGRSAEAFGVLAARHGPAVARTVKHIVRSRTDAADVSQFVFLELAKTRAEVPGTLSGWLRVVARNAALAFLRAKRRRLTRERRAAKAEAVDPPPAPADEALAAALATLPPPLGEAVRLRYLDGFTQEEAAAVAGVPRGTLSRRAAEGVRLLRERLSGGEQTDGRRHSD